MQKATRPGKTAEQRFLGNSDVVNDPSSLAAGASTLVIPAHPSTLHIKVPVPEKLAATSAGRDLQLIEQGEGGILAPVQLVPAEDANGLPAQGRRQLVASIPPREGARGDRRFLLVERSHEEHKVSSSLCIKDASATTLEIWDGPAPVFAYHYGVITGKNVPEKEPRRTRACYVHPVWGLHGEVLTGDFPRDHYHHHGIFWAWPHVRIDGKQYDLWLGKKIRQRFRRCLCRQQGPVTAVMAFENGWFRVEEQVAVERVWMRTYPAADGSRAIDLSLTWVPIERPITLWGAEGKSYGGLSMRFAERQNTVITVPEGRTKDDLKETRLPWADLTAQFDGASGPSGATVMVPPDHPDYPPTWLTRHYGVLCVGYPGVRPKTFPPGKSWHLEYRVWVHQGAAPLEVLQEAYAGYVATAQARWEP